MSHEPYETATLWDGSTADGTAVCPRFQPINTRTVKTSDSTDFGIIHTLMQTVRCGAVRCVFSDVNITVRFGVFFWCSAVRFGAALQKV